ncbi:MAG: serine/threonine-protein kinase [bacterium]
MPFPKLETITITKKVCNKVFYNLYDAINQKNGQRIYLKLFDKNLLDNEKDILNFYNITRIISLLNSPYICKVYDYGQEQNYYYIITETIDSEPLNSLNQEKFSLTYSELIDFVLKIGMTLRYAHLKGVVHGLLNPECIYVSAEGTIKIDDFGFYLLTPYLLKKQETRALNLTHYIAPEVFSEIDRIDGRADIYSLGVIIFQLITGHLPFNRNNISTIQDQYLLASVPSISKFVPDIPISLEMLVSKSLNKNPENRFHNFKDFVEELKILKREFSGFTKEADELERKFNLAHTQENSEKFFTQESYVDRSFQKSWIEYLGGIFAARKYLVSGLSILILLIAIFVTVNKYQIPFISNNVSKKIPIVSSQTAQKKTEAPETDNLQLQDQKIPATIIEDSSKIPVSDLLSAKEADLSSKPEQIESKEEITFRELPANHEKSTESQPSALGPITATFFVKSKNQPVDASIYIDGQFKGRADNKGKFEVNDLEPNRLYTVQISKDGYSTLTQKFTATKNAPVVSFDLKPKMDLFGTIILDALPQADSLYIDGKVYKGKTPLKVILAEGEHRIRYVNLNLNASWEKVVNLKVGQVLTVRHNFNATEVGFVAVSLKNAAEYGFGYVYIDGKLWNQKPNTTPLKIKLPVGSHTIAVNRDGFDSVPKDTIVVVEKGVTKYVSFTIAKIE